MLNLSEEPLRLQERQRQPPRQYGGRRQEREPGRNDVRRFSKLGIVPDDKARIRQAGQIAPRVANIAQRAALGPRAAKIRPTAIQQIQILIGAGAGRGAEPQFELHLVTGAQRGYSFALLAVYAAKFTGRCFFKRAARPSVCAQRRRTRSRAARILDAEAMNTFVECYACPGTASSAYARWRCG